MTEKNVPTDLLTKLFAPITNVTVIVQLHVGSLLYPRFVENRWQLIWQMVLTTGCHTGSLSFNEMKKIIKRYELFTNTHQSEYTNQQELVQKLTPGTVIILPNTQYMGTCCRQPKNISSHLFSSPVVFARDGVSKVTSMQ
eukprot:Lithocolla_globosa_v1_NODE_140_length_5790_cov_49.678989.p7 type:complete len:140 gc:universal NODE_140_length_5790_cov_49.678989:3196-3615(+)